jgi:hypothetical protein
MNRSAALCFNPVRSGAVAVVCVLGLLVAPALALASQPGAEAAISRADARIEMATRQAGVAGDQGDQSYNMARSRLDAARAALKSGHDDQAQRLAEEASVLAELTSEKAKLAALQTSRDLVAASIAAPATVQQ